MKTTTKAKMSTQDSAARIGLSLGIAAVQFLAVKLGLVMGIAHGNVSPVWPATGFAIAVLLRFGTRHWPFLGIGSFIGLFQTGVGIPVAAGETAAAVLEAVAAVWLVRRWIETDDPFSKPRDAIRFCLTVGGIATAISATVGVTSLCLGGLAPWQSFDYLWGTWWLGDTMGALIVAPFLFMWTQSGAWTLDREAYIRIGAVFVFLILTGVVAFWGPFVSATGISDYPIAFVTLPMVVTAAFLAGGRGATAACVICTAMAISGTARGLGPFFRGSVNESLLLLQSYLIVISATAVILAAVLNERNSAVDELRRSRNELDDRVSERTRELVQANEQLKTEVVERRQAEEALKEEKRFTETALNCQLDTFFLFDPATGSAIRWNRAFSDITGYSDEEIARMPAPDSYYSQDDLKRAGTVIQDTLKSGVGTVELEVICKDGRTIPTEYNVSVVKDTDGSREYLIAIGRDVTERKKAENDLRSSEARFRALIDQAADAIFVHDDHGRFFEVNQQASASLGYTRDELLSMSVGDVDPDVEIRGDMEKFWPTSSATFEARHRRKDGSTFAVEIRLGPIEHSGRKVILAAARDITDRKSAEDELKKKEELLKYILDASPVGIAYGRNRIIRWANPAWEAMFGFSHPDEYVGKSTRIYHATDEDFERTGKVYYSNIRQELITENDTVLRRVDGTSFHGHVRIRLMDSSETDDLDVIMAVSDISDRKKAEAQIKANLKEKEILLREVHHRVKNNLTLVCSLLSLQAGYADETHRRLFEDLEMRVMSMALAHEKLYKTDTLADLDLEEYVSELIDHLVGAVRSGASIRLIKDIHGVSFGLDTAIPVGFVLTELVSNCLKHAFPDVREGEIRISLRSVGEKEFELVVSDNGVGMPEEIDLENSGSLGMDLVHAFVVKLKGRIEIRRENGTEILLRFKEV